MDCSICLENMNKNNEIPNCIQFCCKQNYHFECIKKWVDENNTCPICRKVLNRNILVKLEQIQINYEEIKQREIRANYIIKTLMKDIENIKERTKNNIELINTADNYLQPEIPPTPRFRPYGQFNFNRLLERRGSIVLPLIVRDDCMYPSFCRCGNCLPEILTPRWH